MATIIKKTLQIPTFNSQGQITGSGGKKQTIIEVGSQATSSFGEPTPNGGSTATYNPITDNKGNVTGSQTTPIYSYTDTSGKTTTSSDKSQIEQLGRTPLPKSVLGSTPPTTNTNSKTNSAAAVSTGKTYQNTLPNASGAGLPNQGNTGTPVSSYDFLYKNPAPKIATKDNPVVKITGNNNTIPNYDDIKNMSQSDLQDFVDYYDLRTRKGQKLTETDEFKLMKANRRLQELQAPQTTSDPYADIIAQQQQQKIDREKEMNASNEAIMQAEREREAKRLENETMINAQQEEKQKNTLGYILGGQGIENSSASADRMNEISTNFANLNKVNRAESFARLQRQNAELRGATRQELEKYDNQILNLQARSADYFIDNMKKVEEYNQSTAKSMQEKIQNIYQLSQAQNIQDLTAQEKEQAKAYARLLLDSKGNINDAFLKQIPSRIMAESIMQASLIKGAIPTTEYGFSNVGNGVVAVTDPRTGKVSFQQGPNQQDYDYKEINGKTYAINKNNPSDIQEVGGQISRQQATSTYGSTPAVRNFNPGNIMDTGFGGQKVEGERFTRFDTPQQGFNALVSKIENIQAGNSSVYSPNMTILQYISKYAPASDNNNPTSYANMIAQKLGVNVNTTIGQLDPVKLASAHAQHEDKNSYKMLLDLGIITQDGSLGQATNSSQSVDKSRFPQYKNYIENGTLPTGMKDTSSEAGTFKNNASKGYLQGQEAVANQAGMTITNTDAFLNVDSKVRDSINKGMESMPAFANTMDKLIDLVKTQGYGTELRPGNIKQQMSQLVRDAQLQAKEIYNLGILNGPDLALMESIITNPTKRYAKGNQMLGLGLSYGDALVNAKKTVMDKGYSLASKIGLSPMSEGVNERGNTNNDPLGLFN